MKKPLVMLLAGGGGTRLGVLVQERSKPSVPFGGCYRIIDLALSNIMHARLDWVGVLAQYKPLSLMTHIGTGAPWNFVGRSRGVSILPPRKGWAASDWYKGTADAVWQSMDFMQPLEPERVLILSGDHVYNMDYRKMISDHVDKKADVTIAVMEVDERDTSRFGMIWTDPDGLITRFEEKPDKADTRLASMGIYIFEWQCLVDALGETVGTGKGNDFGQHVIPRLLGERRLMTHRFDGYWRDVGTISSYFDTNMDVIDPASGLCIDDWEVCTNMQHNHPADRPPARLGAGARVKEARLSAGCRVDGSLQRVVLSPDVTVAEGASVTDAVLMDGVHVGPGAVVKGAVVDKGVVIGAGTVIDGGRDEVQNAKYAKCDLRGLVLIGKRARLPGGLRVGSNVVIEAGADESSFSGEVEDGSTIGAGF